MYLEAISRFWNVFSWRLNWMWGEYMIKVTNFKIVWCAVTCLYAVTSRRLWQNASVRRTYNLHDRMRSDLWCCANKKSHHIVYWNVFRLNRYSLIVTFVLKKSWNFGTAVLLVEAMTELETLLEARGMVRAKHISTILQCVIFILGVNHVLGMCHGVCGTPASRPNNASIGWMRTRSQTTAFSFNICTLALNSQKAFPKWFKLKILSDWMLMICYMNMLLYITYIYIYIYYRYHMSHICAIL